MEKTFSLKTLREKWRAFPAGIGTPSERLLDLPDAALLHEWQRLNELDWRAHERGWYRALYLEFMKDRRVFDIGSGLGADGIYFLRAGARWTFSDIGFAGIEVVRRICGILSLEADFVLIDDHFANLASLPDYDVIWCNGSLMDVPFDVACAEAGALLPHLVANARWIECCCPPERPYKAKWFEPYDAARMRDRLAPASASVILDFNFHAGNLKWLDLELTSLA